MKRKTKKYPRFHLFVGIICLFLLVACSGDNADESPVSTSAEVVVDSPPTDEAQIVTFAVWGWEKGLYEEKANLFMEENPSIQIEMIALDEILGDEMAFFDDPCRLDAYSGPECGRFGYELWTRPIRGNLARSQRVLEPR